MGNMGAMICLGQGGLRSLSASSSKMFLLPPWKKEVMFLVALVSLSVSFWPAGRALGKKL